MSPDYERAVKGMRNAGYLVLVWTPDDLEGLRSGDLDYLEDLLTIRFNELIEQMRKEDQYD